VSSDRTFDVFAVDAMPRLRRLAYAWCHDWHHSDDVVQDTVERVYAGRGLGSTPAGRRHVLGPDGAAAAARCGGVDVPAGSAAAPGTRPVLEISR
jgi:hypothetical protein